MLRKYMVLYAPDANNGGDSSAPPDANDEGSSPQQQDANDQSTEGDPNQDDSTLDPDPDGNDNEPTDVDTGAAADQPKEQQQAQDEEPALVDKPEDAKLDFHKHQRFQELVKEKNEARAEVETLRNDAERTRTLDNYLQSNGIPPQDFAQALDYLRALRTGDTQAALAMMRPTYEMLLQANGERLPADLEAKVAANTLDVDTAKELARLRANTTRSQATSAEQQNYAAMHQTQLINSSFAAWGQMKAGIDPDFRPKANSNAPDGVWEMVDAQILRMRAANPPRNTVEAQKMAQAAYDSVTKFRGKAAAPKVLKKPVIGSFKSSPQSRTVIKTGEDVVKAYLSGARRPEQLKYS